VKERFKRVIAEWLSGGPPEALDREVELPLAPNEVVTVTGARRAGKTYLLFSTIRKILDRGLASQDEILYVDFEDSRLRGARAEDLDGMVEAFVELAGRRPRYLFLDEVQRVGGYGGWLRRRLNAYVYLSGSTSELTPRRVADEMRGRSVSYEVYPLSFREFLRFKGVKLGRYFGHTEERGKVLSLLREYLQYGAYPAVALSGDRERLLRSYFDSVVVRDLSVVKPEVAEYFADTLICGYSSLISMNKVYGDLRSSFRVGKETVSSLFDRAEETYFAFLVEIFDKSLRRRRMNPKKLYVIDTGYVRVRGCEYSISKAMENAVFLELKRRGVGDIYYWKEYGKRDGREVDFVVARNFSPLELIQVTYAEDKVERREVEALKKAREELKAKRCTVVTWDYEGEEDGIRFVPLWRWLLEQP
jgi:predicted AAA+ superfamily ATPase